MTKKKIWLVLCEGKTDKIFLDTYHDATLANTIRIQIYSGDFLTNYDNDITLQNVIGKLTKQYSQYIKTYAASHHIRTSDIERIIYMTDTDNCIALTNEKYRLLKKLAYTSHLKINSIEIKFNLLLMSNDLEHVVIGRDALAQGSLSPSEKEDIILDFTDEYDTKQKIDEIFDQESRYQYSDYQEFKINICDMKPAITNLNTIYTE